MHQDIQARLDSSHKWLAIALSLVSALSIFAMLHHPSVSASDVVGRIEEINQESAVNSLVHGVLIGFTLFISFCLSVYGQQRSLQKPTILCGTICYWLGTAAMVTAALMSGFVSPHLAQMYTGAAASQLDTYAGLSRLVWATNQAFAYFGAISWALTMMLWSRDMMNQGKMAKGFAAISSITGLAIIVSLLGEWVTLNVFGMTLVLVAISIWHIGIAILLYRQSDIKA